MTKVIISCYIAGASFQPSKLFPDWNNHIIEFVDAGSIATSGGYRGQIAHKGHTIVAISKDAASEDSDDLLSLLDIIEKMHRDLIKYGAQEFSFFITHQSKDQINWDISAEIIQRLAQISAELFLSYDPN